MRLLNLAVPFLYKKVKEGVEGGLWAESLGRAVHGDNASSGFLAGLASDGKRRSAPTASHMHRTALCRWSMSLHLPRQPPTPPRASRRPFASWRCGGWGDVCALGQLTGSAVQPPCGRGIFLTVPFPSLLRRPCASLSFAGLLSVGHAVHGLLLLPGAVWGQVDTSASWGDSFAGSRSSCRTPGKSHCCC